MADEKQTITLADFKKLLEDENKPKTLDEDKLMEYSISALNTLKGLQRRDKFKVILRMRKMMG